MKDKDGIEFFLSNAAPGAAVDTRVPIRLVLRAKRDESQGTKSGMRCQRQKRGRFWMHFAGQSVTPLKLAKCSFPRRADSPPLDNTPTFKTSVGRPRGLRPHPQVASVDEADKS